MTPELLTAMVLFVTGVPDADISCSPSAKAWAGEAASGGFLPAEVAGLTWVGTRRIRLAPWVCRNLRPGTFPAFLGDALSVVAHEATHYARRDVDEVAARRAGCAWVARLAQRFYGVTFHTRASRLVASSGCAE